MKPAKVTVIHVQVQLYVPNALVLIFCIRKTAIHLVLLDILETLLSLPILVLVIIRNY